MTKHSYDCIIVGGGVIGLLTARLLQQNHLNTLVLDQAKSGQESTWAGGGILSPLYPWRWSDEINQLASWSQNAYHELTKQLWGETGIDAEHLHCGMLVLDEVDADEIEDWSTRFSQTVEPIAAPALRTRFANLAPSFQSGYLLPDICQVRNPRLGKALRASLHPRGIDLIENRQATRILHENGRVLGVDTGQGAFYADRVVIACGAWSAQLLDEWQPPLPIYPVKGQMIVLAGPPELHSPITMHEGHYLIPRKDGRILVGSTVEHAGFNKETTVEAIDQLRKAAISICPTLERFPIETKWAGLRPGSADQKPFIGPHPALEGLYINAGHFRNGLTLAPGSARLLSDLMLGNPTFMDAAPFAVERAVSPLSSQAE